MQSGDIFVSENVIRSLVKGESGRHIGTSRNMGVYNSTGELVSDNRHLASAYFKDLTIYESILGLELLWPR